MTTKTLIRFGITVVALLSLVAGMAPAAASSAGADSLGTVMPTAALPAPYSGWDVNVSPLDGNNQVLHLTFDSPLLQRRITNTVYLPDSYRSHGSPMPVMYALHGTVFSPIDNCALNAATSVDTLLRMIGCGGGYLQDQLYDIPSQLSAMHFLTVSPDTSPDVSICETCMWVNGRADLIPAVPPATARELPANSFLHQELYPLVQTLFNVRTDRGGRGVMGFSMGGWAAALQGMIHPDDYSYLGYVSGGYNIKEPELQSTIIEPIGYLRDQGYSTSLTDPVWWQQYNPMDIATNLTGTDTKFFLSSGDACVNPVEIVAAPECQGEFSPVRSPSGVLLEQELSLNRAIAVRDLTAKGIPFTTVETPGTHGANNAEMFAKYIVPQANAKFAGSTITPSTFSYRTAIPTFSVWGYGFTLNRQGDSFLNVTNAHTDGTALTVAGAGNLDLTTPATFTPGRTYTINATRGGRLSTETQAADSGGRLHLTINLGNGTFGAGTDTTTGGTTALSISS